MSEPSATTTQPIPRLDQATRKRRVIALLLALLGSTVILIEGGPLLWNWLIEPGTRNRPPSVSIISNALLAFILLHGAYVMWHRERMGYTVVLALALWPIAVLGISLVVTLCSASMKV